MGIQNDIGILSVINHQLILNQITENHKSLERECEF